MNKDLVDLIASSPRQSRCICLVKGDNLPNASGVNCYRGGDYLMIVGEYLEIDKYLKQNASKIDYYDYHLQARNSALPLLDYSTLRCRVEPGAIIRIGVHLGDNAVVMMGAVINIGARIGRGTMIDMNAVVGARAIVGDNCHIGAGAVIAGVLEPPSKQPAVIEDNVLIGANAVILEGVRIGQGAIIGAGAVVTKDVAPNQVAIGQAAQVVKSRDQVDPEKIRIVKELREP